MAICDKCALRKDINPVNTLYDGVMCKYCERIVRAYTKNKQLCFTWEDKEK